MINKKNAHFIYVLTIVLISDTLAEPGGIEPIINVVDFRKLADAYRKHAVVYRKVANEFCKPANIYLLYDLT